MRMTSGGTTVISYNGDVRCIDSGLESDAIPIGNDWDALICCHGVMDLNWFENADARKVRQIFDVNLTGSYLIAQEFVRATINSANRKKIVFMGSMAYTKVLNGSAAYCASKAGLAMLTRCLAWELAPKGYDVYCVHPSNVENAPMSEQTIQELMRFRNLNRAQAEAYWSDSVIRDHQLTKEEISWTVQMLLRGEAGFMSGSNIELAGGAR